MVIAGKEDLGNNLSNFGKKFLWSRVLTNLDRALLRPRPNDTIIYYYSNYDELLLYHHTHLSTYIPLPPLPTIVMCICNIYYNIYMCMCMYVLCYDVLCVAWCTCTPHCPLLFSPASLSVRG